MQFLCTKVCLRLLPVKNFSSHRYLDFAKLGIETFRMDQHEEAIAKLKSGRISKAIFEVNKT